MYVTLFSYNNYAKLIIAEVHGVCQQADAYTRFKGQYIFPFVELKYLWKILSIQGTHISQSNTVHK